MQYFEDLGLINLKIIQDDNLYKFTSDAVMLSKFVKVKNRDVVADFCSGSGIVGFHLYGLNPALIESITFFEMQKPLYDMSVESIKLNNLIDKFSAENVKVQDIGKEYYEKFSLIVCNPPYMAKDSGEGDKEYAIAVCRREITLNVEELILSVSKCLKFGGRVNLVHRADRLADVIFSMRKNNIEPKRLQFVSAKNKAPYLFMIEGVKGGKSGLTVLPNAVNL